MRKKRCPRCREYLYEGNLFVPLAGLTYWLPIKARKLLFKDIDTIVTRNGVVIGEEPSYQSYCCRKCEIIVTYLKDDDELI